MQNQFFGLEAIDKNCQKLFSASSFEKLVQNNNILYRNLIFRNFSFRLQFSARTMDRLQSCNDTFSACSVGRHNNPTCDIQLAWSFLHNMPLVFPSFFIDAFSARKIWIIWWTSRRSPHESKLKACLVGWNYQVHLPRRRKFNGGTIRNIPVRLKQTVCASIFQFVLGQGRLAGVQVRLLFFVQETELKNCKDILDHDWRQVCKWKHSSSLHQLIEAMHSPIFS